MALEIEIDDGVPKDIAAKPFAQKAERATLAAGKSSFLRHMKEALEWVEQAIPKKPSKRRG